MAILRMSHIGIVISDLQKSIDFYCNVFGFKVVGRFDAHGLETDRLLELQDVDLNAVYLERDGTRIELMSYRNPEVISRGGTLPMNSVGITHLAFRVSDLENTILRVLQAGGSQIKNAIFENAATGSKAVFVLDPDGVRIELLESPANPDRLPGSAG